MLFEQVGRGKFLDADVRFVPKRTCQAWAKEVELRAAAWSAAPMITFGGTQSDSTTLANEIPILPKLKRGEDRHGAAKYPMPINKMVLMPVVKDKG